MLPYKKINNFHRNNLLEEIKKMRNSKITDTLTSVDIVEIAKCRGGSLEVYAGFFLSKPRVQSSYRLCY